MPDDSVKWMVIKSELLDDSFIYLLDKQWYKEAVKEHPDLVIYMGPEIEMLANSKFRDGDIKAVHAIKKQFGPAWVMTDEMKEKAGI